MTSNSSPKNAAKIDDPKALQINRSAAETQSAALARASLRPTVQAAVTLLEYNKNFGELSINTLVDDLSAQCAQASKGDLSRAEALLTAQAHTLDSIFNNLAQRAARNMGEYLNAAESYMRLALKAQSQCRATLETLATVKNPPPVTFVRQANVANGPQQVNNGAPPPEPSRARESENPPNKLLEHQHEEWLDGRAPQASSAADSQLAAVEEVHGTADARR